MKIVFWIFLVATLFSGAKICEASDRDADKPNILFILADDLGYSDLGCYGSIDVKTPHIDRLASKGLRFTNYHAAASICSPSRAALLTGAYPQRAGLYLGINPNREAHWFLGLHPDEITIAEQCKEVGYTTLLVGKWHLGTEKEFSYFNQGFDAYYGMPCNYNHSSKFFDGKELVYENTPLERLTELYTRRITSFIEQNSDRPFFLFYSHNYPHTPYKAGKRFEGSSGDGVRGDVIQEFDWSVGEIVKALEKEGVLSNTIIIFSSDNGPVDNKYAGPYRGTKFVSLEGGHRVPLIFEWDAGISQHRILDIPVYAMDLFPTLSEIIGAKIPAERKYDGHSILPVLQGGTSMPDRCEMPFYYYNCENLQAISYKNWKLHLPRSAEQFPWWDKNKHEFTDIGQPVLFDLLKDTAESRNVVQEHPELVLKLLNMAEEARKELGEYNQRGSGQRPTGNLFPGIPVISHPRDWEKLPDQVKEAAFRK